MRLPLICTMLALAAPVAWADSMRCGNRVLRSDALAAEVIAACGAPDYRERWHGPDYGVDEERWHYNFGPQRLVRVLRFRRGALLSVATDGYGFDAPASACAPTEFRRGVSAFRLLSRCGEPVSREWFEEPRPYEEDMAFAAPPAYRERWVYDLGGDTRMRIVTLRDGRVSDVETGHYGSPRREAR